MSLFTLILFVVVPLALMCSNVIGMGAAMIASSAIGAGGGILGSLMGGKEEEDPDRPKRRRMTKNFERMMLAINAAWDRKQQAMIGLSQAHMAAADQLR